VRLGAHENNRKLYKKTNISEVHLSSRLCAQLPASTVKSVPLTNVCFTRTLSRTTRCIILCCNGATVCRRCNIMLATCYYNGPASHDGFHSQLQWCIIAAPFLASAAERHLSTSSLPSSNLASCWLVPRGSPAANTKTDVASLIPLATKFFGQLKQYCLTMTMNDQGTGIEEVQHWT